ncbi:hypothetical protein [Paraburkholderia strydomiana]|uniref:hypothetical protein n=1 Tax=Paraburkholderia strydomiana TaxID=1245417 RepID=UPI002865B86B|nr:hypothetical protein [Paraburkholderia strydomiana]MDR7006067.1 hypothetical protein [Paraburkholderia strydomiana]
MDDNVHVLPIAKRAKKRRTASALPRAEVHQLDHYRPPQPPGHIDLPSSREEVQAMFDEMAHHLLMTVRVITSRLR